MSLKSINVNNSQIVKIDDKPIPFSKELTSSGAIKEDIFENTLSLKNKNEINLLYLKPEDFMYGTINSSGTYVYITIRCVTKTYYKIFPNTNYHCFVNSENWYIAIEGYDNNLNWVRTICGFTKNIIVSIDSSIAYIRVLMREVDDSHAIDLDNLSTHILYLIPYSNISYDVSSLEQMNSYNIFPKFNISNFINATITNTGQYIFLSSRASTIKGYEVFPKIPYEIKTGNKLLNCVEFDENNNFVIDYLYNANTYNILIPNLKTKYVKFIIRESDNLSDVVIPMLEDSISDLVSVKCQCISNQISLLENNKSFYLECKNLNLFNGTILGDGSVSPGTTIRLTHYEFLKIYNNSKYYLTIPNEFGIELDYYTINGTFIKSKPAMTVSTEITTPDNAYFMRVVIRYADSSNITVQDVTNIGFNFKKITPEEMLSNIDIHFIPTYWETYINNKIVEINRINEKIGSNGDSFVFITDTHYEINVFNSIPLIEKIVNNTNTKTIFHGGDFLNYQAKNTTLNEVRKYISRYNFSKMFITIGNHDVNTATSQEMTPEIYLSDTEIYSLYLKDYENDVNIDPGNFYYYLDNERQKIRYFFLDAHWPSNIDKRNISLNYETQLEWMESHIKELNNSWSIVVLQHIVYSSQTMVDNVVQNAYKSSLAEMLVQKLDTLYDLENIPTIIAVISGHTHYDWYEYSTKGYPIIASNCDSCWGWKDNTDYPWAPERETGTINEQSFDVFSIDKNARKIYLTKVGYGENREFNY